MSSYLHSNYSEDITQPNDATYAHFVPTVEALENSLVKDRLYILWAANQKDHGEDPTVEKYLQHLNNVANYYGGDLNDADLPPSARKYSPLYHALRAKERAELKQKVDKIMTTLMLGGLGAYGFAAAPMLTTGIGAGLGAADYLDVGNAGTSLWNPGWKRTTKAYNDLKSGKVLDPTVFAGSVGRDVLDVAGMAGPAVVAYMRPEVRLAGALNKNIKQGIQSGLYYHGSPNRNISMFKTGKDGGIYFTQNRDAAKLYTGTFGTGKVYNVDLNLGNKTITIDNGGAAWTKIPENTVAKAFNLNPQQVHDIIGSYNLGEVPWHYGFTKMFGYKPKNNYYAIDQVVKLGKDLGISSLIIKNAKDNGKRLFSRTFPYDLTVVYDPRQIILSGPTPNLNHYAPLPQMSKTSPTKTSLAFFERQPAKISDAERLGIPKGIKYYTQEENLAFRNQINNFAKKYGYEPIGDEVTDPEVLERYARSLIKRHNTFYRGVELNPEEPNLSLEYMATHAPGGGAGELYITPYLSVAAMYGEPVEILRPYKLGFDRPRWFDEGDFQIYTAEGRRDMHLWEDKKGIAAPWLSSEKFEGKTSWIYKPHVETELTGRNLLFIPMSIQYRSKSRYPLDRVGSLAVPNTPFYKSGGSIHIKKKNKGKFTASAKDAGEGVQEHAHKVMNDPNATPLQKKRANFAIQAKKWHRKHQLGGKINYLNIF